MRRRGSCVPPRLPLPAPQPPCARLRGRPHPGLGRPAQAANTAMLQGNDVRPARPPTAHLIVEAHERGRDAAELSPLDEPAQGTHDCQGTAGGQCQHEGLGEPLGLMGWRQGGWGGGRLACGRALEELLVEALTCASLPLGTSRSCFSSDTTRSTQFTSCSDLDCPGTSASSAGPSRPRNDGMTLGASTTACSWTNSCGPAALLYSGQQRAPTWAASRNAFVCSTFVRAEADLAGVVT